MKRRMLVPVLAGIVAVALTGCLDWVEQTMTYRHDPKTDTVRIFQQYHGLFASEGEGELSKEETEQFDSVMKGQRTFFFANWVTEFNRAQLEEELAKSTASTPDGDGEELARKQALKRDLEVLLKLALDNVRVENGSFYVDAQQRLSGTQRVTIGKFSQIVASANRVLRQVFAGEAAKPEKSDEERAALKRWLDRKEDNVVISGNRLLLRLPMTRAAYEKDFVNGEKSEKTHRALVAGGGERKYENDAMTIRVGAVADAQVSVRLPVSDKVYRENFRKFVQGRKLVVEGFKPAAALAEFLEAKTDGGKR